MPLTNTRPISNLHSPFSVDAWRAPAFAGVLEALLAEQEPIYVVGGAVRDFLLGRDAGLTDLDLALAGPVLPLARRVADRLGWAYYPLDAERDVARIVQRRDGAAPLVCDLAALRGDLAQDLALRDFTVNALALQMTADGPPHLIDRCDGVGDLRRQRIRAVTRQSLAADPIRTLRALRFAAQLGFTLAEQTAAQIPALAPRVTQTSPERQRDELWKMLGLARPGDRLADMQRLGLLVHVLPEVAALDQVEQSPPHRLDVLQHTCEVMDGAAALRDWLADRNFALPDRALEETLTPRREQLAVHFAQELASGRSRAAWLVWHALFHDTGKPACASVETDAGGARRIRFFGHAQVSANIAERRSLALRFSRR